MTCSVSVVVEDENPILVCLIRDRLIYHLAPVGRSLRLDEVIFTIGRKLFQLDLAKRVQKKLGSFVSISRGCAVIRIHAVLEVKVQPFAGRRVKKYERKFRRVDSRFG